MSFAPHIKRYRLLALSVTLVLITICVYPIRYIRDVFELEIYLNSHAITFNDFPGEYTRALNESILTGQPLQYETANLSSARIHRIPRIIHNIWGILTNASDTTGIPEEWRESQTSCKHYNPDYKIYTWTSNDAHEFLQTNYPWFVPTYDQYTYAIQRVDALKYFVLLHYGGVYMDLDVTCRRPLDALLAFEAWFPHTRPTGVSNDLMATRAGHPLFRRIVERLRSHNFSLWFTYSTVMWSTGPQFVNDVLLEWIRDDAFGGHANIDAHRDPSDFLILPPMFYSEQYSFFGHLPGSSWHGDDVAVVAWFWARKWAVLGIGCVVVFLSMKGVRRLRPKHTMKLIKSDSDL